VIAYHLAPGPFRGGFVGVDIFFVLSGFLITTLLLEEHDRAGRISLRAFYVRRCRRLVPALAFFLVLCVVAQGSGLVDLGGTGAIAATGGYATNVVLAFKPQIPVAFAHTWSLALEEQFYLVWPLLLVVLLRGRRRTAITATALGVAFSAALPIVLHARGVGWMRLYYGPDTRSLALLAGCLTGQLWHAGLLRWRPGRLATTAAAVVLLGWLVMVDKQSAVPYVGGLALVAAASGVLLLAALAGPRLLTLAPLTRLGRWSYALYLLHPLVSAVAGTKGRPLLLLPAIAVSLALAAVVHRYIERPLMVTRVAIAEDAAAVPHRAPQPEPLHVHSLR